MPSSKQQCRTMVYRNYSTRSQAHFSNDSSLKLQHVASAISRFYGSSVASKGSLLEKPHMFVQPSLHASIMTSLLTL